MTAVEVPTVTVAATMTTVAAAMTAAMAASMAATVTATVTAAMAAMAATARHRICRGHSECCRYRRHESEFP